MQNDEHSQTMGAPNRGNDQNSSTEKNTKKRRCQLKKTPPTASNYSAVRSVRDRVNVLFFFVEHLAKVFISFCLGKPLEVSARTLLIDVT